MGESEQTKAQKPRSRAVPIILIVLATIIGIVSVFGLWAKRQLLETETWTTTSERLIQDSDIQAAVSNFAVTAIYRQRRCPGGARRAPATTGRAARRPDCRGASQRRRRRRPEGARSAEGPAALGGGDRGGAEQADRPDRRRGGVRLHHRRGGDARPQIAARVGDRATRPARDAGREAAGVGDLDRGDEVERARRSAEGPQPLKDRRLRPHGDHAAALRGCDRARARPAPHNAARGRLLLHRHRRRRPLCP